MHDHDDVTTCLTDNPLPPPRSLPSLRAVCQALKKMLLRADRNRSLAFINVAHHAYHPDPEFGAVSFADAMTKIHAVRRSDGTVRTGKAAVDLLYEGAGMGWAARASQLPGLSAAASFLVDLASKNRFFMQSRTLDSMLALKKAQEAEAGPCGTKEDADVCEIPLDLLWGEDASEDLHQDNIRNADQEHR